MSVFQLNSTAKLLPPANFYNFKNFVRKTHLFYFKKAWSLNFLRTVTISVDSTASLMTLPFSKTSVFLEKLKYSWIVPNPNTWTFWETLLIPSNCTANLLPSAIFEKFNIFSENPFFFKKTNSQMFREISLFRSQLTSSWLTVSVAVDIKLSKLSRFQKIRFLFRKNHPFFQNPNFRVILLIQSTCGKFATFSPSLTKQFKIFFRETHLLFKNKTNFERFEKPYSFSRFLQQNC